ncbi:RNA polymerase sigma-70 factor [Albibacterium bauzanense]|uniref:RNA polymerase sigma-70 factor (ECF subfamily) n=1 Tax=Albibacterium bauzanense TaxID=653929 RepID=A0A4R1LPZ1_9SPHI|nr:RNA polymerase sigma-70 factor [Albibacterium bauzanense]TCK80832.1 RNA polymerase sigma-70 factor (ECF subfamily) [Albibacterium bauzanense]
MIKLSAELNPLKADLDFEELFKAHFKALYAYAYTFLKDELAAEEIVQNLFMRLWEKKEDLMVHTSIKAFLYRSVYNDSLNYLKHQKVKLKYQQHQVYVMKDESSEASSSRVQLKELEERLHEALSRLPEGCRTVFQMSRFEELKYREIADRLNISIKTVENQMGKALKLLRLELIDFLPLLFLLLNLYKL